MLPNPIFTLGDPDSFFYISLDMYTILIFVGIVMALVVFDFLSRKRKMSARANRFYYIVAIISIVCGLFGAKVFQWIYNWIETGVFEMRGMTFLGGLVTGAAVFLLSMIFANEEVKKNFWRVLEIAPCCILIAHFFGRLGCFCAGCCYGKPTDSFIGIAFPDPHGVPVHPTQLYEAAMLLVMFGVTLYMNLKDIRWSMIFYLYGYGIGRFLLEFVRGDDRGTGFIPGLSPSQATSILLVIIASLLMAYKICRKKFPEKMKHILPILEQDPDYDESKNRVFGVKAAKTKPEDPKPDARP